ncbi:DNA primase [Phragmitibacter flavus]|uniref:DNA primase n=1 Tax=Phragmitibacter flavus TaxID=2576071 RepID=UPI00140A378A|nr:DNA primase [Phragmitibacter flavus]
MARIPEDTLQQVLHATDIVDLVGRYVKLRRVGTNWRGLCPFHNEKTPSFYVNPQRSSYHCFGCGAGGTAIRFLMEHDGLQFMDAVKRLADAAGIPIHEEIWDANAERAAKIRNAILRVHSELTEWFHHLLLNDPSAKEARSYLKSRGINRETATNWKMGYAPATGDAFKQWAAEKKYTENLLVHAGILARGDADSRQPNQTYPRFRHRLMFPIRNDFSEVIAFSGRLLDNNAKAAKYLNSPETVIFNKSRILFGLDKSKRAIIKAGRAIVCEGQIDLITAFEHGIENVVAPLGTAFTEFHARVLKRHAEEVVLCFDSDSAGFKAAQRAYVILAPVGLIVKAVSLPNGEDPDSLIRTQGVEALRSTLNAAKDFIDHAIDHAFASRDLTDTREKTRFSAEMAPLIRQLDNAIARDAAIQNLAIRLGIPEADYRRQVARAAKSAANNDTTGNGGSGQAAANPLPTQERNAALLCRYALSDTKILNWLRSTGKASILNDIPGTELLALIWNNDADLADTARLSLFLTTLQREEESALSQLLSQPMPGGQLAEAQHALELIEIERLKILYQRAHSQLKQPNLDPTRISSLNQDIVTLRKEYLDRLAQLPKIPPSTAQ